MEPRKKEYIETLLKVITQEREDSDEDEVLFVLPKNLAERFKGFLSDKGYTFRMTDPIIVSKDGKDEHNLVELKYSPKIEEMDGLIMEFILQEFDRNPQIEDNLRDFPLRD